MLVERSEEFSPKKAKIQRILICKSIKKVIVKDYLVLHVSAEYEVSWYRLIGHRGIFCSVIPQKLCIEDSLSDKCEYVLVERSEEFSPKKAKIQRILICKSIKKVIVKDYLVLHVSAEYEVSWYRLIGQ